MNVYIWMDTEIDGERVGMGREKCTRETFYFSIFIYVHVTLHLLLKTNFNADLNFHLIICNKRKITFYRIYSHFVML